MSKPQKTHKPMASRTKGAIVLCVMLCITVILGVLSVTGMALPPQGLYKLLPWVPTSAQHWPESISLGLDLQGGVYVNTRRPSPTIWTRACTATWSAAPWTLSASV